MKGFSLTSEHPLSDAELVNFFRQTANVPGLFVRMDGNELGVAYFDDLFPESAEAFADFERQFFDYEESHCECGDGHCGTGISEETKQALTELAWTEEDEKNYALTPVVG